MTALLTASISIAPNSNGQKNNLPEEFKFFRKKFKNLLKKYSEIKRKLENFSWNNVILEIEKYDMRNMQELKDQLQKRSTITWWNERVKIEKNEIDKYVDTSFYELVKDISKVMVEFQKIIDSLKVQQNDIRKELKENLYTIEELRKDRGISEIIDLIWNILEEEYFKENNKNEIEVLKKELLKKNKN